MARRVALLLAMPCAALALAGCSAKSAPPPSNPSAVALLARSAAAVATARSVSFTDTTTIGHQTQVVTGRFGPSAAQERLVATGGATLEVREVDKLVYVNTTSATELTGLLGLSAAQAQAASGRWITISSSDAPYGQITEALSISAVLGVYLPVRSSAALGAHTSLGGVTIQVVTGSLAASSGLRSSNRISIATSSALPVVGALRATQGSTTETKAASFSAWGAPVVVSVPQGATPLASFKP